MTDYVTLTKGGKPVYVNMNLVEYITPSGAGAELTFLRVSWVGADSLTVRESPDEIMRRSASPCV